MFIYMFIYSMYQIKINITKTGTNQGNSARGSRS